MPVSSLSTLFALTGLVAGAAQPVPPDDLADAQLRALNHRFVGATVAIDGDLMETLTHPDFLLTDGDGHWRGRAEFVATMKRRPPRPASASQEMQVRLFGPVAVVHGLFATHDAAGPPSRVHYTDVHVWSDGAWRLVSVHDTPVAEGAVATPPSGPPPRVAPWTGQDPSADDADLLPMLNERYVQAFRDADVAWYGAHLAHDYVMVSGDGARWDRAATLARFAQPTFATSMRSFPVDRVTVRRFHDVALIHAENAYELKDGRRGVSRYTDIWLKRAGRWLCIAAHITERRSPTAATEPATRR